MKRIFILWHTHELAGDGRDEKLVGVYESIEAVEHAKVRASRLPGFADAPGGFEVAEYEVGKDHWTEGFVTAAHTK